MTEPGDRGAVVVTGAGRGIGRAIAERLARAGYPLVLLSKTKETLDETVALCERRVATRSLVVDVRDEGQVRRVRDLLADVRLHAVVNNAGVGIWSPVADMSAAAWDEQLDTNLRGVFLVVRETLPAFRRQGRGLYVNIGSDSSLVGMAQRVAYNASKFGLVGLTATLRAELVPDGIQSSIVFAGRVDTYFRGHRPGDREGALLAGDVAEAVAFVVEQYPRVAVGELTLMARGERFAGPRSLV